MSSKIKVFKYGLHRGEEQIVAGNQMAGMINFSGCHLRCNFCYTPETSIHNIGTLMNEEEFRLTLQKLKISGAKNINLISPTHQWAGIETSLRDFQLLPVVLKVSGYEKPRLIQKMSQIADVFVPDFKVWDSAVALSVGLPANYGEVALNAIDLMMQTHPSQWNTERKMNRGILVRHLIMPGHLDDSLQVIGALGQIHFHGILNLMTHFLDPLSHKLITASPNEISILREHAFNNSMGKGFQLLVDGKIEEVACA